MTPELKHMNRVIGLINQLIDISHREKFELCCDPRSIPMMTLREIDEMYSKVAVQKKVGNRNQFYPVGEGQLKSIMEHLSRYGNSREMWKIDRKVKNGILQRVSLLMADDTVLELDIPTFLNATTKITFFN
jgi:hypothetical protein